MGRQVVINFIGKFSFTRIAAFIIKLNEFCKNVFFLYLMSALLREMSHNAWISLPRPFKTSKRQDEALTSSKFLPKIKNNVCCFSP